MRKTSINSYLLNALLLSSLTVRRVHANELLDNLTDVITDEWLAEEILPTNYNRDKAPNRNENPVRVEVRISILELSLGTGSEMAFNVDMFKHQYWTDNRLRLPAALIAQNKTNAKIVLSPQWKSRLWTPDIHFTNAISGTIVNIVSPSLYFVVTNQTNIFMAARLQMKLHCNMDFTKYPFDSQTCQIMMATLSETIESVQLNWLDFRIGKHFYLPHYEITDFATVDCAKHNQIGVFSCLMANIYLSRNTGKYFIKRYVPSFLIQKYGKSYATDEEDRAHHQTYLENKERVESHNEKYVQGYVSYYKGINQYTDMTYEQIQSVAFGFKVGKHFNSSGVASVHTPKTNSLPMSVDWRTKGAVTPVKDQGSCGSCWAFSTVGTLEGQHQISTGKLVSLSEQNLVDCTTAQGNYGCGGGWPFDSYEYIIRFSSGIDTEMSYPYAGVDQTCMYNASTVGATATAFAVLTPDDESGLQEAVANIGPISVCIDANGNFMGYEGGVYDDSECSSNFDMIDHCVLAVGYGTDSASGKDYWLVKNSWGTTWGDKGYIKMVRNKMNQCAISTLASYPTVKPTF